MTDHPDSATGFNRRAFIAAVTGTAIATPLHGQGHWHSFRCAETTAGCHAAGQRDVAHQR